MGITGREGPKTRIKMESLCMLWCCWAGTYHRPLRMCFIFVFPRTLFLIRSASILVFLSFFLYFFFFLIFNRKTFLPFYFAFFYIRKYIVFGSPSHSPSTPSSQSRSILLLNGSHGLGRWSGFLIRFAPLDCLLLPQKSVFLLHTFCLLIRVDRLLLYRLTSPLRK